VVVGGSGGAGSGDPGTGENQLLSGCEPLGRAEVVAAEPCGREVLDRD